MTIRLTMGQLAAVVMVAALPAAMAATPDQLLAGYTAKAGAPASAERGQAFFKKNFGREMGFSCSSCHTENPLVAGKDQVTEKRIKPLAPAANSERFTDAKKTDFHFDLNCRDVVGRVCTAGEKADVLAWLVSLKP